MHELHINKDGQVQQWWINFLTDNETGGKIVDIVARFKEWNADIVIKNNLGDRIIFKNPEDMTMFFLRWS